MDVFQENAALCLCSLAFHLYAKRILAHWHLSFWKTLLRQKIVKSQVYRCSLGVCTKTKRFGLLPFLWQWSLVCVRFVCATLSLKAAAHEWKRKPEWCVRANLHPLSWRWVAFSCTPLTFHSSLILWRNWLHLSARTLGAPLGTLPLFNLFPKAYDWTECPQTTRWHCHLVLRRALDVDHPSLDMRMGFKIQIVFSSLSSFSEVEASCSWALANWSMRHHDNGIAAAQSSLLNSMECFRSRVLFHMTSQRDLDSLFFSTASGFSHYF